MVPTLQQLAMDQNVKNILAAPPLIREMVIDTTVATIKKNIYSKATKDMQAFVNMVIHRELSYMKSLVPEIILDLSANIDRDYFKKYPSISPTTINYARDTALIYLGAMEQ